MPQTFACFPTLPPEIRQIVYSKMNLIERLRMARTSADARDYMRQHKVFVRNVELYVSQKNGTPTMNIQFDQLYEERYKLFEEMIEKLRTELDSHANCACAECNKDTSRHWFQRQYLPPLTVVELDWKSIDDVFYSTQFVKVEHMSVNTEPYGGLIETVQPTTPHQPARFFGIHWHQRDKNTRKLLDLEKWTKWIEFFGSGYIQVGCDFEYVDKELFNCEGMRNARGVYAGQTRVDINQIRQFKGMSVELRVPSACISNDEYYKFFREKLLEWIADPTLSTCYGIERFKEDAENGVRPPHYCLVEDLGEVIQRDVQLGPEFKLHMNWDDLMGKRGHCIVLRHMPSFASFLSLPVEIRQIVFSKMELIERFRMGRASRVARDYFKQNIVKHAQVKLYVSQRNGAPSMNIRINDYEERHKLSDEMVDRLRIELDSYANCACSLCTGRDEHQPWSNNATTVVELDWESIDNVLYCTQFVRAEFLSVTTHPYGGLVESIAPPTTLRPSVKILGLRWHKKTRNSREDLNFERWNEWIEFFGTADINLHTVNRFADFIDKEIFNCRAIRDATNLFSARTTISMDQLRQLNATTMTFSIPDHCITRREYVQFYREKLLEWIADPLLNYTIVIDLLTRDDDGDTPPPHNCLVEELEEVVRTEIEFGPHLVLYNNWDCTESRPGHMTTIRSVRTNTALMIFYGGIMFFSPFLLRCSGVRWPR